MALGWMLIRFVVSLVVLVVVIVVVVVVGTRNGGDGVWLTFSRAAWALFIKLKVNHESYNAPWWHNTFVSMKAIEDSPGCRIRVSHSASESQGSPTLSTGSNGSIVAIVTA